MGITTATGRRNARGFLVLVGVMLVAALALLVLPHLAGRADADVGGDRTLWLYHTHTHETGKFTFRKNGRYDPKVLAQLDYFLRDWRNDKVTHMDPRLFDLLWTVYQKVGATEPYHIVSSYRTPKTNAYLRKTSSGVAKNSQHMKGKAMDVFIPGVPLAKLRQAAMQLQVGGVGYYPHSGSPFVHMDVASVRAWPRMTTAQLRDIFPRGRTLHLPADGKPLSASGRRFAMEQWKTCHTVPCDNGVLTGGPIGLPRVEVAEAAPADMAPVPARRLVRTIAVASTAPRPAPRPDDLDATTQIASADPAAPADAVETATIPSPEAAEAPIPATMSRTMMLAMRPDLPAGPTTEGSAVMAIAALEAPVPAPPPNGFDRPEVAMTAYAPVAAPDPEAERALRTIIARAGRDVPPDMQAATITTASLTAPARPDIYSGLVDMTWRAVGRTGPHPGVREALENVLAAKPIAGLETRRGRLVAPDFEHVADIFANPAPMTSARFGTMFEPDEADLSPGAELGPLVNRVYFVQDMGRSLSSTRFTDADPLHVASR